MSVMPVRRLVFNVTGVDGNLPGFLFGGTINVLVGHGLTPSLFREHLGDGLCESGFAVVDVADGADVNVRFIAVKFVPCCGKSATGGDVKPWRILRGRQ